MTIRSFEAWPGSGPGISESLARSIEDLEKRRAPARKQAELIDDSLALGGAVPEKRDTVALRGAIESLSEAADQCAEACEVSARNCVAQINHHVRAILEQLERRRDSASGQPESILPHSDVKAEPTSGSSVSSLNLAGPKEEGGPEDNIRKE